MTWFNADGTPAEDQGQPEGQPSFQKSGQGQSNVIMGSFEQTPAEVAATYQPDDPHEIASGRNIAEIVQKARQEEAQPAVEPEIEPLKKSEELTEVSTPDDIEALKTLTKGYDNFGSPPGKIDPGEKVMADLEHKGPPYDATTVMQDDREYLEEDEDNGVVAQMAALHEFVHGGRLDYADTKNAYMRKGLDFKEPEGGYPLGTIKVHRDGRPFKKIAPGKWQQVDNKKKPLTMSATKSPMEVRHAKKVRGNAMRSPPPSSPTKKSEAGEDPIDILSKMMPAEGTVRQEMPSGASGSKGQAEDGGVVEAAKGPGTSATDAGLETAASVTGAPSTGSEKLSEDDAEVEAQMTTHKKPIETRKSMEGLLQLMRAGVAQGKDVRPIIDQIRKALPGAQEELKKSDSPEYWTQYDGAVLYSNAADRAASERLEKGYYHQPDNWQKGEASAIQHCSNCDNNTPAMYSDCQHCGVLVKSGVVKSDDTIIIG